MTWLISILSVMYLGFLFLESRGVKRSRNAITHVVHVNGTRGKSTVSRLIEAGLRAGGLRVFCKTTGTDPMTIDVAGEESPIYRRGRPNIKEQLKIMAQAAAQNTEVLVVECMAVLPELQHTAQHDMLKADIGVITNVRRDHTDVMGESLEEICNALSNTIPQDGVLFTAETEVTQRLARGCNTRNCTFYPTDASKEDNSVDFPENIALALAVCVHLGVPEDVARQGMANFKPDPYALSVHQVAGDLVINGLSINDVQSTCLVYQRLSAQYDLEHKQLILLVNNRADRGSRTEDMLAVCVELKPSEVWLLGASQGYMSRGLEKKLPQCSVRKWNDVKEISFTPETGRVIFAIGNIANEGRALMVRIREEGKQIV